MSRIAASVFASLGILLATPALPQGVPTPSTAALATQYLSSRLSAGMTLANYLQSLRNDFAQLDADGDGAITTADIALHDAVAQAAMVAMAAQQTMVMDLNGDGVVTEDEVRQVLPRARHSSVRSTRTGKGSSRSMRCRPISGHSRRGVPKPDGDPGHSTVISEETGRPVEFK